MSHREPEFKVNGILLTEAQAMSVRVAIGNMLIDLSEPEHMAALGEVGPLYRARLREVESLMPRAARRDGGGS